MKFTEEKLELAIIQLLTEQGYPYTKGDQLVRSSGDEVLIKEDLRQYLSTQYAKDDITTGEIDNIVKKLETLPASDLYESNKTFCQWLSDGFLLKREAVAGQPSKKDLYIQLIDYDGVRSALQAAKIVVEGQVQEVSPSYIDNNIVSVIKSTSIFFASNA